MNNESKICFVTGNQHKFQEAKKILSEYGLNLEMVKAKMLEIQNNDIMTIAVTSIKEAHTRVSGPIIVEDAGLFIKQLNDFPGPYSAYVYQTLGCKGILKLLEGQVDRDAEFRSAVAYTDDAIMPSVKIFLGIVKGKISVKVCGKQGFGFDPIFMPEELNKTFGEIRLEQKSKYSHRAMALKEFASWYLGDTILT